MDTNVAPRLTSGWLPQGADPWPVIRQLIAAFPAAAYATDAEGRLVTYNEAAVVLWGREPVAGLEKWCGSFRMHWPDGTSLPLDQCPMATAIQEGRSLQGVPAVIERPDGIRRDVLANPQLLRDSSGAVVGAINTLIDITETKAAERALAASEEGLRKLLAVMPVGVCAFDAHGRITYYNQKATEIWGWQPDLTDQRFTGAKHLFHLDGSPLAPANSPMAAAVLEGRSERNAEFIMERPDGSRIVVSANIDPLNDPQGQPTGAIHIFEDVTSSHASAAALQSSEARLRHLFETAAVSIWEEDFSAVKAAIDSLKAAGVSDFRNYIETHPEFVDECIGKIRILDVNPATLKMLRAQDKRQVLGSLHTIFTPQTRAVFAAEIVAIAEGRETFEAESTIRALDGSAVYAVVSIAFPPSEPNLSRVPVTLVDITASKQAEEERAQLLKIAQLLNRVGPMINSDLDDQKLTQNVTDLATEATGAQFGAFFHNSIGEDGEKYLLYTLSGVPREAFANFPMPRNTAVFGPTFGGHGVVRSDDITKDPRYGKSAPYHGMPEGHLPVHSYLAVPVISRSGEVLGGLFFGHEKPGVFTAQHEQMVAGIAAQAAVAMDNARLLAATRRSEYQLARSNAELSRANTDLEQFAFSASHDLQEPIRNISIFSEILSRRYAGALDEKGRESLEFIAAGAQRLHLLVRSLLTYAQSGENTVEQEEIESSDALEAALDALSSAIAESQTLVTHDNLPRIRYAPIHLQQIFQNLVGNAIKYRREGTPPAIHISCSRAGRLWRFSVGDNGLGIDPQFQDRIFGIFKRLHSGARYSGSGIGLAICKRIVDRNGGSIWVESPGEGWGSTFFFTIPGSQESTP